MNIGKIDRQVLKLYNAAKVIRKVQISSREQKYMQNTCSNLSQFSGIPLSNIQKLTKGATYDQFTLLRTLINKFNYDKFNSFEERANRIFNIYSEVKKPSVLHLNIIRKSKEPFESLENVFSLAKDEESLQFVENLQYGELKNSKNPLKIIADLLNSKNRDRYISKTERYSSYIELHANNDDAVKKLDYLIETGKYSRFRSDAQLAVKKLFKKQRIETAMSGKSEELEKMYTKDRANFLKTLVNNYMPAKKVQNEDTKAVVLNMYGSMDKANLKLRQAIVERFKISSIKDKTAEIVEMQSLFNKIDKDLDAKSFVQKAIDKDLKIGSIKELNEVLSVTPLKKANIFFNNAKRIIERSTGKERTQALVEELENPFFESKAPKIQKARIVRMFSDRPQKEGFFSRTVKIIENKFNQFRYNRMSA